MRRWAWALFASAAAAGCAAEEGGTTTQTGGAPDATADGVVETLAGFEVVTPSTLVEGRAFTLAIQAQAAEGGAASFTGTVTLSVDRGAIEPETAELVDGAASVEARLLREGAVLLTVAGEGVQSDVTLDVDPMQWQREPEQDAVAKAGLPGSWRYGGWRGASVVDDGPSLRAVFATGATGATDGTNDVLGLASSADGGLTWTVAPEAPVLKPEDLGADGLANPQLVKGADGIWHLFVETLHGEGGALTHGIRHATSPDGAVFTLTDCPLLGVNAFGNWTTGGVGAPHAVLLDDGRFALWFTAWSKEVDGDVARVGRTELTTGPGCAESIQGAQVVVERGGKTAWNELRSFSPAVWRDGPVWRLLFAGQSRADAAPAIGYATSDDGLTWEVAAGGPVLQHILWDGQGVLSPSVASLGTDGVAMFFEGLASLDERSRLGRAVPKP